MQESFTSPSEFPTFSLFYFIARFWLCGLRSFVDCFLTKQYVAWRAIVRPGLGYIKKSLLKSHDKTRFCSCIFERISIKMEPPQNLPEMQTHIICSKANPHWKYQGELNSSLLWFKQNYAIHNIHTQCLNTICNKVKELIYIWRLLDTSLPFSLMILNVMP